jgi:hypothetical protein
MIDNEHDLVGRRLKAGRKLLVRNPWLYNIGDVSRLVATVCGVRGADEKQKKSDHHR